MDALGDKIHSKKVAEKAGVSIVPGFVGEIRDEKHMLEVANSIGYPVMIKASAGGGGKGIRLAHDDQSALEGYRLSKAEARSSFGDDRMLVEKAIVSPRHVEIQLIGDKHGNLLYLPERDCSVQRRNQKVIEESPSPFLDRPTWRKMGEEAVSLGKATGYYSAGTCEMMVDKDMRHYFLELNARLQVEHPVSEEVTGIDLVEQMIRCAAGLKLTVTQKDCDPKGWAMESRIYAEDPYRNYLPSIGSLHRYHEPCGGDPNVRIDSAIEEGSEISMFYDPMIAKVITKGETRLEAVDAQRRVLDSFVAHGLRHNICLLRAIYDNPVFRDGKNITTSFLPEQWPQGFTGYKLSDTQRQRLAIAAACLRVRAEKRASLLEGNRRAPSEVWGLVASVAGADLPLVVEDLLNPSRELDSEEITEDDLVGEQWLVQLTGSSSSRDRVLVSLTNEEGPVLTLAFNEGSSETYQLVSSTPNILSISAYGTIFPVVVATTREFELGRHLVWERKVDTSKAAISPMPGRVKEVNVKEGQVVEAGEVLLQIEAMKMINLVRAVTRGTVKSVNVKAGSNVAVDEILVNFA
jgi:propionyl-CoA carboxylase alpha chain